MTLYGQEHIERYLNLEANPDVDVQVKGDKIRARARTATPEEKQKLWPVMTREWPAYHSYQERRTAIFRWSSSSRKGERRDSNPRPPGPQPGALPAELRPPRAALAGDVRNLAAA